MATIFEPETTMRVSCRTLPLPSRAVLTQMTTRFCASANWLKPTITSKKKEVAARILPPRDNPERPRLLTAGLCANIVPDCRGSFAASLCLSDLLPISQLPSNQSDEHLSRSRESEDRATPS